MTPTKKEDIACPLPGCNMITLADAIKANNEVMTQGFNDVNELQQRRIKQDTQLSFVIKSIERLEEVIDQLRENNRQVWQRMGEKVDDDALTNAMVTVNNTFKQLKNDMKWFIGFAMGAATIIIALLNFYAK